MAAPTSLWFGRTVFISLGLFVTLIAMLPLGLQADAPVSPDIFFCLAFAWSVRRPSTAPILLIFIVALFADIMLMRPIGLWTLVLVLVIDFVRQQRFAIREQMFAVEVLVFAIIFAVALLINYLLLRMSFSPAPGLTLTFKYFLNTVATYPIVVGILHYVFRVRVPKTGTGYNRLGRVS